jgi:hypothetical protein
LEITIDGKINKPIFDAICNYQQFDCLLLLMTRDIEVFEVIQQKVPLIHYVSQYSKALSVVEYMFYLDPSLKDYFTFVGRSPLTYACRSGCFNVVRYLIGKGTNPLHVDRGKKTLLHHATLQAEVALIDLLLSYGIAIDASDSNEKPALHYACELGNSTVAEHLISRGADINAQDIIKYTPVKLACGKNHPAVMQLLLTTHKAKLNGIDWQELHKLPK